MIPIVFAIMPTIVGSALLIGLNNSGNKGVLLFGAPAFRDARIHDTHLEFIQLFI